MKNAELLTLWENAVNRVATSWKAKSSSRICSNHFTASDYLKTKIGSIHLKKNAVPTQQLTGANYKTSELDGLDKPALKRRCSEESRPPMQIVMHDHRYAKSEAPESSESSQVPETLSNNSNLPQLYNLHMFHSLHKCHHSLKNKTKRIMHS